MICSRTLKSRRQSTKEDRLKNILNRKKLTVPVLEGRKREEHPPRHSTPIRAALASAREMVQYIRAMHRPVQKRHACCMALVTIPKSAKCLRNTPKNTSHSDHSNTRKPAPEATSDPKPPSLKTRRKRLTP